MTTMRIQDSLYYQDFSYVIKVGRVTMTGEIVLKRLCTQAGFYFTGQVNIESRISVRFHNQLMVKYLVFQKVQSLVLLVNYFYYLW